jgi:hypothetical protein
MESLISEILIVTMMAPTILMVRIMQTLMVMVMEKLILRLIMMAMVLMIHRIYCQMSTVLE